MRLPLVAALALIATGCGPDKTPDTPDSKLGVSDDCEGGLVRVDDDCVVLRNALEVLLFRTSTGPYVSTCTTTITGSDPGVEQAVLAERAGCRVIDTDLYGAANFEPGPRESGVTLRRDEVVVPVDEAELFDSCIERRTLPAGFMDFGGTIMANFAGSTTIPAFDQAIDIPADPDFRRGTVTDGGPVAFTWRDVGADSALIVVSEMPVQIVCAPAPGAEQFEVPADFMAMLPESDPPGLEPVTSIRMRNRIILPYTEANAAVTLTADTYQSSF